ncbi:MAG: HAD-IIIA family hydrolase [Phycisphaerales bacterium]|nr:HAD-IIIA family hydrolase [Phycisphaerales bacterium]
MNNGSKPAVFVDRDATLIEDRGYLRDPSQVHLLPGTAEAVAKLRESGYPVIVVTNQSGVARGYLTEKELGVVHKRMQKLLKSQGAGVDAIYYCPYLDSPEAVVKEYRRDSDLRKPKPGMLLKAAKDLKIDLKASWMVGDAIRDVQAGEAAGCRTILLGNGQVDPEAEPDFVVSDFRRAAELVMRESKSKEPSKPEKKDDDVAEESAKAESKESPKSVKSAKPPKSKKTKAKATKTGQTIIPAEPEIAKEREEPRDSSPAEEEQAASEDPVPLHQPVPSLVAPPETSLISQASETAVSPDANLPDVVPDMTSNVEPVEPVKPVKPVKEEAPSPEQKASERPPRAVERLESKLDQMIEELRTMKREQRYSDFSFAQLLGAIAQAVALCTILWGLFAAIDGELTEAFTRVLFGIAFQLIALTGFVLTRRK